MRVATSPRSVMLGQKAPSRLLRLPPVSRPTGKLRDFEWKSFFFKIEMRVVLLLTILGLVGCLAFGAVVLDRERGKDRTVQSRRCGRCGCSPARLQLRWTREKDGRLANRTEQFDGRSGWTLTADLQTNPIDGYLLLSRTAIEEDRSLVELVDLSGFSVRHVWRPDADGFLSACRRSRKSPISPAGTPACSNRSIRS